MMQRTRWTPSSVALEGERRSRLRFGRGHVVAAAGPRPSSGRPLRIALAAVLLAFACPATSYGEMVFGYYPGYRFWQMSPDKIDWSAVNCVIHFAAEPHGDGTVDLNRFQLFPSRIEQMVQLARDNDACVLLTVGGANTKWAFASATADNRVRDKFIKNIVDVVAQYGYDGIDIDWEPLQDSDGAQFTALIRGLRARLDAVVPGALLTAAVPFEWGTSEAKNTTSIVAGVIDDLDYIHLMSYALAGPWGGWVTWHNSALFNGGTTFPNSTKELPSAELMVEQYAAAGVAYDRMSVGLAFFGKIWQGGAGTPTGGVTAPRQSWTTKPTMSGEYQYHEIIARGDFRGNERWDDLAQNPYVGVDKPGSADDLFIPYEDPRSIKEKVRYAAAEGLGGVMIWELRGDYLPDGRHPLLTALKEEYLAQYGALPGDLPFDPIGSPSDPSPTEPDPDPTEPDPDPTEPDPDPAPQATLHVGDLDTSVLVNNKKSWTSAVRVRVHDETETPVPAATVSGRWSSGASSACKTDGIGHCAFAGQSFSKKKYSSVTFSVTGITHGSLSYAPAVNHDSDGDSDGTTIKIMRP